MTPTGPWRETGDGVVLTVHVQPGAAKSEYAGRHGEALKVRIAAPPVEGAANAALCAFLAKLCGLPRSAVQVERGETSRRKQIHIKGRTAGQVMEALGSVSQSDER